MSISLSPEQQQALDQSAGHLLYVTDSRTSAAYVLIPASQYESVREALEDDRVQKAVRSAGMRNAVSRAGEEP
jgi:PHD/YefM family antitoxin component YafN of YafNO toxin-antitoxin module